MIANVAMWSSRAFDDDRDDRRPEGGGHKRKRGGFLGDLFELGG